MPKQPPKHRQEEPRLLSVSPTELDYVSRGTVLGFDEAGRGPLAGPVSIALVHFSPDKIPKIRMGNLLPGLTDSKKLSALQRERLFGEIQEVADHFQIQMVSSGFIDKKNINQAIFYAIFKALKKLPVKSPFLILDGNYRLETNLFHWQPPPYISIKKADEYIVSVSAASVLAKVYRDRYMKAMGVKYNDYGFEEHMGYGTKKHREAIETLGVCKIHRMSYLKNILSRV